MGGAEGRKEPVSDGANGPASGAFGEEKPRRFLRAPLLSQSGSRPVFQGFSRFFIALSPFVAVSEQPFLSIRFDSGRHHLEIGAIQLVVGYENLI